MKRLVFIGSHLGYPMDRTPLGGGAMVGLQLARRWVRGTGFKLHTLGSGPVPPDPASDYVRLASAGPDGIVNLSEWGYARFCRRFEAAATAHLLDRRGEWPPGETCVVLNDISEAPDVRSLSRAGYPIVTLWHVDVVDFFNKIYLRGLLDPERLAGAFERLSRLGAAGLLPDVLKLVFEKQRLAVACSGRLILPSRRMAETLRRCYRRLPGVGSPEGRPPQALEDRIRVVPWGAWNEPAPEADVEAEIGRIKAHYQIGPRTRVLITLSRISPEKGLDRLLAALRTLESARKPPEDVCVFICGEPAFMRGASYARAVRTAAERLRRWRVFFPGHLDPTQKRAYFRCADLFISPSVHESYGLSIVEAMRAGLPVLATDHNGAGDILRPPFSRVVPRGGGTARLMAEALEELLSDPPGLDAMGREARRAAEAMRFDDAADAVAGAALSLLEAR